MSLQHTPAAEKQAVRMKCRALLPEQRLVIVEGRTDSLFMRQILRQEHKVHFSRGKDRIMPAYEDLTREFGDSLVFLVDCDDSTPTSLKGRGNLVISQHRDLESDLVFALDGFRRVGIELYGAVTDENSPVEPLVETALLASSEVAASLHDVRVAARSLGLPLKIRDPRTNRKRGLRPLDVSDTTSWFHDRHDDRVSAIATSLSTALRWPSDQMTDVVSLSRRQTPCSRHAVLHCYQCAKLCKVNGHDLVQLLVVRMHFDTGMSVSEEQLARDLRVSSDLRKAETWHVVQRLRRWEASAGSQLLAV